MTSIKTLLKIASLSSFISLFFYHVHAVDTLFQNTVNEDTPEYPCSKKPLGQDDWEHARDRLQNTDHLSRQVEMAFKSLFEYNQPPSKSTLLVTPGPGGEKIAWKSRLDSIHNILVRKGVLQKLAHLSKPENGFTLNTVMRYIIRERDPWPFDEVVPILQQNSNFAILIECLDHSDWLISDNDREFVKKAFQLAVTNYNPRYSCEKLCSRMVGHQVVIQGTEEAAIAFLMVDELTRKEVQEDYLKVLILQPLRPETKSNILSQLIPNKKWNVWAVTLIQQEGWPTPPNWELPKIDEHSENNTERVRKVFNDVKGLIQTSNSSTRK